MIKAIKDWVRKTGVGIFRFWRDLDLYLKQKSVKDSGVLVVGRHTYFSGGPNVQLFKGGSDKVRFGSFCSIAKGVEIMTDGAHPVDWVSTYPFRIIWGLPGAYEDGHPPKSGDINIGNDVWIASEVMVLPGVTIGDGAVIAARSVVTRDIPPYSIAGGVPAKVIRYRFSSEVIDALLKIKWWEWNDDKIKEAIPFLSSDNIEEFISRYGSAIE